MRDARDRMTSGMVVPARDPQTGLKTQKRRVPNSETQLPSGAVEQSVEFSDRERDALSGVSGPGTVYAVRYADRGLCSFVFQTHNPESTKRSGAKGVVTGVRVIPHDRVVS